LGRSEAWEGCPYVSIVWNARCCESLQSGDLEAAGLYEDNAERAVLSVSRQANRGLG